MKENELEQKNFEEFLDKINSEFDKYFSDLVNGCWEKEYSKIESIEWVDWEYNTFFTGNELQLIITVKYNIEYDNGFGDITKKEYSHAKTFTEYEVDSIVMYSLSELEDEIFKNELLRGGDRYDEDER